MESPRTRSSVSLRDPLPFHPGLEGLRGVAVLGVLLFHAEISWLPGGFLGVSTFFTLSGFLITRLLLAEHEQAGRIALGRFWARRVRRLLPASLVALLAIALGAWLWADVTQLARLRGDGLAALAYVANWWLIATGADYVGLMGSPSPVQHFWSLAIEEQYYAVYPLLCAGLLAIGRHRALASVLVVGTAGSWLWMLHLAGTEVATARIYFGTDTRCAELLAGGLLAIAVAARATPASGWSRFLVSWGGVLGVAVSGGFWAWAEVDTDALYRGGLALYTLATVAVVAAAVQPSGPLAACLSYSALRWLGRVSYGAYVYHWPIFLWLDTERTGLDGVPLVAAQIGTTLVCAGLSYRFLEEPIRKGRRIREGARFVAPPLAIGGVALALSLATLGTALPGAAPISPEPEARQHAGVETRIAVVGDSLAANIANGLVQWSAGKAGVQVDDLANQGCGIAKGAWPAGTGRDSLRCDRWPSRVSARLDSVPADLVIVSTAGWDLLPRERPEWSGSRIIGDPDFDRWLIEEYKEALHLFVAHGARVVWLTTPCFQDRMGDGTGVFDPSRSRHLNDAILRPLAETYPEALRVIDLDAEVCPGGRFSNSLHAIDDFRPDGIHFSDRAARWVGEWLGQQLVELSAKTHWRPESM